MKAPKRENAPVYIITGFLESGKTKFITEMLEDDGFSEGERTLLLCCEEGYLRCGDGIEDGEYREVTYRGFKLCQGNTSIYE